MHTQAHTHAHTHTDAHKLHTTAHITHTHTPAHTHACACAYTSQKHKHSGDGFDENIRKKTTNQGAEEKRWVFNFALEEESEVACLTEKRIEFQMIGPIY